jgi:hypothetical protein
MFIKTTILSVAIAICFLANQAKAEEVKIDAWPDDVPCGAIAKGSDGWWYLNATIIQGPITRSGLKFKDSVETRFWDRKCGAAPKR